MLPDVINKPKPLTYNSGPSLVQVPREFMPNFQQAGELPPPQGITMQDWLEFQQRGWNPLAPEQNQQLGQVPVTQQAPQLQTLAPATTAVAVPSVVAQKQAQTAPLSVPPTVEGIEAPEEYAMPYTASAKPRKPSSLEEFIMGYEKFSSKAYDDFGQRSIGYGMKARDTDKGPITEKEARSRLQERLASDKAYVQKFGKEHGYDWKDNQIDALTSFIYNLGPKALAQVTANGTRSLEEIPEFMKLYFNAGGVKLRGLEKRRNAEADWYNS